MRTVKSLLITLFCLAISSFAGERSVPIINQLREPRQIGGVDLGPQSPAARKQQREAEKALNKKRQEDLKRDTDKLLELATELKQYVDKTNENIISFDVVRKAAEIERLAKSVQKKAADR